MSLSDLASIGSFVSGIAVLASLMFLYVQMRQMERNQQALISQGVRTRSAELMLARTEPALADALLKGYAGDEDISPTQYSQFIGYLASAFIGIQDAYLQHKDGLITDDAFVPMGGSLKVLLSLPGSRQYWDLSRDFTNFAPEFIKFVEDQKTKAHVRSGTSQIEQWKAGVIALKANALKQ